MKLEIEKSSEAEKRNRQSNKKPVEKIMKFEEKVQEFVGATNESKKLSNIENSEQKGEEKSIKDESHALRNNKHNENNSKEETKIVLTELPNKNQVIIEQEVDEMNRAESPRPAPPVFDENFDMDAFYSKDDRLAKEKLALELAQKAALEEKEKELLELGQKKQALSQLENKFEDITSKYNRK